MNFSLFLGCIAPNRLPQIEASTIKVMEKFGIKLIEMEGASCCPAPGAFKSIDRFAWLSIAARNLAIAEENGTDVLTVCNGCFATLQEANLILKDKAEKDKVNNVLSRMGKEYKGSIRVRHFVDVMYNEIGLEKLREISEPIGLKIAPHYGCHLLKPSTKRRMGSPEHPKFLERLVEALGAEPVEYEEKNLCCGGGGGVRGYDLDESLLIAMHKLKNIKDAGADAIVTPCSFCSFHYRTSQPLLEKKFGAKLSMPVFHISEFLALAMGLKNGS